MNPSRSGLSGAAKTGIVVALVVVVLVAAYVGPSMLSGKGAQTQSTSSQTSGSGQPSGLLWLFGQFSQMQLQEKSSIPDPDGPILNQQTLNYRVLGKASFNSTQHTKVQFSQTEVGNEVVAWFNSAGTVDRLDIIGDKNYSGPAAAILAQTYTRSFGMLPDITNNATLLALLSKTTQNTTSIGPTQMDVVTYHLAVPAKPYSSITAEYATIPGTNQTLVVYLHERMTDKSEFEIQVLSLSK